MNKLLKLQSALLKEIDRFEKIVPEEERDEPTDWERVHISSCAKLGYLLGAKRGVDPILAACACAVHDYGRIMTGKQEGHAERGYLPVQEFLRGTALFTEEEIQMMAEAVRNHSKKSMVGTALEEIVKDADVLDFFQYGADMPRDEQQARLDNLLAKSREETNK